MRKVYIDCGAWTGDSVIEFRKYYNDYDIYAFECHPAHNDDLIKLSKEVGFTFINKAVWTKNEKIPFYLGTKKRTAASTLHKSKKKKIDKENPILIDCISFSKWIMKKFDRNQYIVCKMNIEGAEYNVLEQMLKHNSISYIDKLFVSWHQSKIKKIGIERHENLLKNLEGKTKLFPWRFVEGQDENPFRGI
ncbi:MAG: FkbM family methyltransferase [Candidatus Thorarchaeota archaeon]